MCDSANSKHYKVVAMAYGNVQVSFQVAALQKHVLKAYVMDFFSYNKGQVSETEACISPSRRVVFTSMQQCRKPVKAQTDRKAKHQWPQCWKHTLCSSKAKFNVPQAIFIFKKERKI